MQERETDVLVVGTGVVGLAVAHELVRRGLTVRICGDEGHAAAASRAAGAMFCVTSECSDVEPAALDLANLAVRESGRKLVEPWLDSIDPALAQGLRRSVLLVDPPQDDPTSYQHVLQRYLAQPGRADEAPRTDQRAVVLEDEASIDARQVLSGLVTALDRARTPKAAAVVEVQRRDAHAIVRDRAGSVFRARYLVLALGCWIENLKVSSAFVRDLKIPPVYAGRGTGALLRDLTPRVGTAQRTANQQFGCGTHLVPLDEQRWYLGATNRLQADLTGASVVNQLSELQTIVREGIAYLEPAIANARLTDVVTGVRPFMADKAPYVGPTPDPATWIATGTYRNGFVLAPLIASEIADEVTGANTDGQFDSRRSPEGLPWTDYMSMLLGMAQRASTGEIGILSGNIPPDSLPATVQATIESLEQLTRGATDPIRRFVERSYRSAPVAENVPNTLAGLTRLVLRNA